MMGVSVISLFLLCDAAHAQFLQATRGAASLGGQTELFALLGQGRRSTSTRLERLKEKIRPMYDSLTTVEGRMDKVVARYALYRYFSYTHGWQMTRLQGDGSVIDVFRDRVPKYVLDLLAHRLETGVGLDELAIVAATLEDLVHAENMEVVFSAYSTLGWEISKVLTQEEGEKVLTMVTFFFLLGADRTKDMTKRGLGVIESFIQRGSEFFLHWEDTLMWARDLEMHIAHEEQISQNPFVDRSQWSFDSIVRLVEMMADRQGQQQKQECNGLKHNLLDLEDVETGRIGLSKFYHYVPEGEWKQPPFSETPEYLRHLGALDESDTFNPRVMVANYLQSKSNCVASSTFYSVCCVNECDGLIVELERRVKDSAVSPSVIAEIISAIPSQTVSAPRKLTASLEGLLDSIARRHGGTVPIHGRLFAQWMHRAFPNECPYPHARGTIGETENPFDWSVAHGKPAYMSTPADMEAAVANYSSNLAHSTHEIMPWSDVEELIVERSPHRSPIRLVLRWISGLLAMGSLFVGLTRMAVRPLGALPTKVEMSWDAKAHYV